MKRFQTSVPRNSMRKVGIKGLGYPLYVNGQLVPEPVTISHVPGRAEAQGILGGMGIDPSMGGMGAYASYSPTRGMHGFGDDAPSAAPINAEAQPAVPGAALQPNPSLPAGPGGLSTTVKAIAAFIDLASVAGLAYHGYKRNNSIGWSIVWALFGGAVPIIGWPVALAQGFGEPKRLTPNRRRSRARRVIRRRRRR